MPLDFVFLLMLGQHFMEVLCLVLFSMLQQLSGDLGLLVSSLYGAPKAGD